VCIAHLHGWRCEEYSCMMTHHGRQGRRRQRHKEKERLEN
jgi:hypothetical protein